jgi:hypothetical protein
LYSEIIAVCSEIHTKHINTVCGQNGGLLNFKSAVRTLTIGLTVGIIREFIDPDDSITVSVGVRGRGKVRVEGLLIIAIT